MAILSGWNSSIKWEQWQEHGFAWEIVNKRVEHSGRSTWLVDWGCFFWVLNPQLEIEVLSDVIWALSTSATPALDENSLFSSKSYFCSVPNLCCPSSSGLFAPLVSASEIPFLITWQVPFSHSDLSLQFTYTKKPSLTTHLASYKLAHHCVLIQHKALVINELLFIYVLSLSLECNLLADRTFVILFTPISPGPREMSMKYLLGKGMNR